VSGPRTEHAKELHPGGDAAVARQFVAGAVVCRRSGTSVIVEAEAVKREPSGS